MVSTAGRRHRRTLLPPPSLSDYGASNARFEDGSIVFASDAPA